MTNWFIGKIKKRSLWGRVIILTSFLVGTLSFVVLLFPCIKSFFNEYFGHDNLFHFIVLLLTIPLSLCFWVFRTQDNKRAAFMEAVSLLGESGERPGSKVREWRLGIIKLMILKNEEGMIKEVDSVTKNINLENAQLNELDLQNINLEGAILNHANLRGSNLKNANLKGADLAGAIYNTYTQLPGEIKPQELGMIKIPVDD